MALDHALLEQVACTGVPVLRLYRWQPACLSFGRNQPAHRLYDMQAVAQLGIDVVRRPTGGSAVLHDDELTYAFVAPRDLLGGPRATYVAINRALVAGLRRLGISAQLAQSPGRSVPGLGPCFEAPAAGEVVAQGRKIVGSAQRSERRTLLQHGSILLDGTQQVVARLASTTSDVANRSVTVRELLGCTLPVSEIANAITAGFEEVCGTSLAPTSTTEETARRAVQLTDMYKSEAWTWRR